MFFYETSWLIIIKLHMEYPWEGGMKVCKNGPGHTTKMVAMPRYCKKKHFKNQHNGLKLYKVSINDDPGLTLTYVTARSNFVAIALKWEK